jgi:broad specificity phosphatase PhoE
MEIHLGAWESLLATEIAARDPERFRGWEKDPWGITPPDGESIKSVRDRVYAAADEILVRHAGRSIGLVAHQLPLVLLKIRYQGIDPALVRKVSLPNTHWEEIEIVVG